jgi:hypothetical protein
MYENNSIHNSLKKNQIPRVNLTKDVNELYKREQQIPEERD